MQSTIQLYNKQLMDHTLACWYPYRLALTFECVGMFRGNSVLKEATFKENHMLPMVLLLKKQYAPNGATFKGKNMLSMGSIFFRLIEALCNPFKPNEVSYLYQLDQSILILRDVGWYFLTLLKS